ncbi:MAG: SH3 domain-containing protein [Deferribacteraceae bacterium]|jgi:hypothetical protein|nr:SH3 domain-containing protein [Deferribacteraceae bacterium]
MNKVIVLFIGVIAVIFCAGCAFKGIDSCNAEGGGAGCTPVGVNLQNSINKSKTRKSASPDVQEDYTSIDRSLLRDEYERTAKQGDRPQVLSGSDVRLRVYAYSDGERFYDTRDIYVIVQKAGWSKGSLIYSPKGAVSLAVTPENTPENIMTVITGGLNVRTGPGVSFPPVVAIKKGVKVHIKQSRNGWCEIDSADKRSVSGWVYSGYLK